MGGHCQCKTQASQFILFLGEVNGKYRPHFDPFPPMLVGPRLLQPTPMNISSSVFFNIQDSIIRSPSKTTTNMVKLTQDHLRQSQIKMVLPTQRNRTTNHNELLLEVKVMGPVTLLNRYLLKNMTIYTVLGKKFDLILAHNPRFILLYFNIIYLFHYPIIQIHHPLSMVKITSSITIEAIPLNFF